MSKPLPIGEYKWVESNMSDCEHMTKEILEMSDESDYGFIFEVDLEYPENLHMAHNDFPFCPERSKLPEQAFDILKEDASKFPKLLLTLFNKTNYVIHYSMLKLALKHGLILKKVHRALQFKQSAWLKPYIDLNTKQRTKAKNEFEKSFYKLLNNSIFGKALENVRSRVDIRLVNKWNGRCGARMLIARPNFKRFTIFDEDLVAVELHKTHILMNKPMIVGMSILEISKVTMYSFLYEYLKPKYGDKCEVIYGDTDSYILQVECDDFYKDLLENIERFDTSDYPQPNEYNIPPMNKKIPGLFKDELNGRIIVIFVGLRAKVYSIRSLHEDEYNRKKYNDTKNIPENRKRKQAPCGRYYNEDVKKSKGVKMNIVSEKLTFDDYLKCVLTRENQTIEQNIIRSIKHNLYNINQKKIGLSAKDDKRYLIKPNYINTLAWGHFMIDFCEDDESIEW